MVIFGIVDAAIVDFRLDIMGNDWHADNLAVGVRNAGTGGRPKVFEDQNVVDLFVGLIELLHARAVGGKELHEVRVAYFMDGNPMLVMVDKHFMATLTVYRLLEAEIEVAVAVVIT